jgi:hypothetical protein
VANDPKIFRIPKEFTLFGSKYVVVIEDDLFSKEDCYGFADDDMKKIKLQKKGIATKIKEENGVKTESQIDVTDEVIIETFYHELCHIIFDALGEEELSANEKLVNMMGKAFLEIYLSEVYDEQENKQ